jgi:serine/threonine-protein kinase
MLDRRYHVRSRIAHGGMATVYLATDTRLDREVALKVMHADLARDDDFVGRFIGEAKSVARLSHPNIVGVYDQGADGQYLYLAMEYVPGQTLRELLAERGWLPWQEALAVMDPVLAGLAAAHQAGIVHRDVKPENVLLTADGRAKVVDFGLARASAAVGNTRAGMIIGSVNYIAPEQVTGSPTDARTDVYAAGIVLFEMLTGRQPFTGETPLALAYAHVNSDVPVVSTLVGGIPPSIDQLVRAATSRNPNHRPADADAFLRVTRALRGLPEPAESASATWPTGAGIYGGTSPYASSANPHADGTNPYADVQSPHGAVGLADAGGGSHTMVVPPGYGGDGAHRPGGRHGGNREPFLQRWLFSRRLVYVLAAVFVLIAAAGGGWYLSSGRYASVPQVARLTAAKATQALRQDGFQVRTGSSVIDDNVPKGEVISTSPSGRALPGATIVLTLSQGPRMITVPPIPGGDSVAQATAALKAAGLMVASATQDVGGQSFSQINMVAGTNPPGGTSVPENKPVSIEVITGLALPSLVGQNINSIEQWAGSNQINLQQTSVQNNAQQGTIVTQSPAAQTPVQQGGTVTVTVSSGPPQTQVPSVQGQECTQAQSALTSAGFQVKVNQGAFGTQVWSMSPSGGSPAPSGSTVTLNCGGFGGPGGF